MKRIDNKVAIVTGAASGIGKAIALLFASEGAKVVVSDIKQEASQAVVDTITSKGGQAIAVVANVAKEEDIQNLIDTTVKTYGTLDIIVNNAGIMDNFEPVEDFKDEKWDLIMSVNALGPLRIIRKAMPIFKQKGKGSIVNISSVGGLYGSRAGVVYTASKHAVIGITKNIGYQYAPLGIRCNAIAPGAINTDIGSTITEPNAFGQERASTGFGLSPRMGEPNEIATAALFLASDEASFINGAVLTVDGGWSAY